MKKEVILEGFHVCKHAVRFSADIAELVTPDLVLLTSMLEEHAPDVKEEILLQVQEIPEDKFKSYSNISIRTPLAGKAHIPEQAISQYNTNPIILLEDPKDLENIGAVVRLAAGMDCAGVVTIGDVDPWHKNCLRGSQGLHFALPVMEINMMDGDILLNRKIIAFDERGKDINLEPIDDSNNLILAFGSERAGMSEKLKKHAKTIVKIPQKDRVASYNLATSVAMGVYHYKINK